MAQHPVLLFVTWTLGLGIGLAVLSRRSSAATCFSDERSHAISQYDRDRWRLQHMVLYGSAGFGPSERGSE